MSAHIIDPEFIVDGPLCVVSKKYGGKVTVVALAGELDLSNAGSVRRLIAETTSEAEGEILVIDLSALEFIDSSGVALLVSLADFGTAGDGLRIVPSEAPGVARVLRLTGVDSMVQIVREPPARAA